MINDPLERRQQLLKEAIKPSDGGEAARHWQALLPSH